MKKKGSSSMTRNHYIPPEILIDILLQLPMKTMLRCKSVSKLWYKIIDDPKFANKYSMNINKSNASNFLLECNKVFTNSLSLVPIGYGFLDYLEQHNSVLKRSKKPKSWCSAYHVRVVGSCNGLICLDDSQKRKYQIMNPLYSITDTYVVKLNLYLTPRYAIGFGFDEFRNKFKIVCFNGCSKRGDGCYVNFLVHELGGSGLGSSNSSWRKLSQWVEYSSVYFCCDELTMSSVFVDGCIHWLVETENYKSVASFNMTNETLEIKPFPVKWKHDIRNLIDFNGSLGMVTRSRDIIRVWVLYADNEDNNEETPKEWIKEFSLVWDLGHSYTVGFLKDCCMLLKNDLGQSYCFNTETGIFTNVPELPQQIGFPCHQGSLIRPSDLASFSI